MMTKLISNNYQKLGIWDFPDVLSAKINEMRGRSCVVIDTCEGCVVLQPVLWMAPLASQCSEMNHWLSATSQTSTRTYS
jgi:hypothetical protein